MAREMSRDKEHTFGQQRANESGVCRQRQQYQDTRLVTSDMFGGNGRSLGLYLDIRAHHF